jgi:adenosylcobyric acid synthase
VIDQEDSVVIEQPERVKPSVDGQNKVGVVRIPHISNFTDFDPLQAVEGLSVVFLEKVQPLDGFHAIILPGSKNTRADLDWLHRSGWDGVVRRFLDSGGHVLGVCGGYQMIGTVVRDPDGLEGRPGSTDGLALLPVETVLQAPKTTTLTRFKWDGDEGWGYEIHMGQTRRTHAAPLLQVLERNGTTCRDEDGCQSSGGRVIGTYLHGLFDTPAIVRKWLATIGLGHLAVGSLPGLMARQQAYEDLADHMETHLDMDAITALIRK